VEMEENLKTKKTERKESSQEGFERFYAKSIKEKFPSASCHFASSI